VYQRVTRLVQEVPSFFLDAGIDLDRLLAAILEFLSRR
jgi:hypothetical protein